MTDSAITFPLPFYTKQSILIHRDLNMVIIKVISKFMVKSEK